MLVILAVAIEYLNFKCSWYLLKPIAFYVSQISKAISGLLNSPKKRTKLTFLSISFTQDSEFCSGFFGRIEETINYLRDLLTFREFQNLTTECKDQELFH